ncbi:MAG: hypothetical protein HQM08_12550 [Candidatus Riflebacteria bacterium]|nr:hypothetical protein [Candidatus Riflebacteria bacterium]
MYQKLSVDNYIDLYDFWFVNPWARAPTNTAKPRFFADDCISGMWKIRN